MVFTLGLQLKEKLYDNMNPDGLDLNEWKQFEWSPGLEFRYEVIEASKIDEYF